MHASVPRPPTGRDTRPARRAPSPSRLGQPWHLIAHDSTGPGVAGRPTAPGRPWGPAAVPDWRHPTRSASGPSLAEGPRVAAGRLRFPATQRWRWPLLLYRPVTRGRP